MPDTSNIFYPPDTFHDPKSFLQKNNIHHPYHSIDDDITTRRKRFAVGLANDSSNKPRRRRYCRGALYVATPSTSGEQVAGGGGPLLWDPREHGALDLDVLVMDQLQNVSSLTPPYYYTTSRVSVRLVENMEFLDSCNVIGRYHASIDQAPCRKGTSDTGKMFGIGTHVHNGRVQDFATKKGFDNPKSLDMCNQASTVLEPLFPHQIIAMRAVERALGIRPKSSMTQSYDQSVNLGNASHYDVMDASTGISVWTELIPGTAKNWYFVLPNLKVTHNGIEYVGVMIKLDHGTAISWDGRLIRHCTSVTDVNGNKGGEGGNFVFGTFWAAKAKTLGAQISRKSSGMNDEEYDEYKSSDLDNSAK
jgi:hypothetical protein